MKTRVNAALDIQYLLESGSTNKRLYHISNPFNIIHSHRLKGILIYIYYFGILIFHGMDDLDHRNPGIAPPPAAGTSLGLAWDLESWGKLHSHGATPSEHWMVTSHGKSING